MKRSKKRISGYYKTPDIVEIFKRFNSKLIPGQKVLVYTDTDREIKSASGEVIGHQQNVLGAGRVKKANDRLIVEINSDSSSKSHPQILQSCPKVLAKSAHLSLSRLVPILIKVQLLEIVSPKSGPCKSGRSHEVFIKPIDE